MSDDKKLPETLINGTLYKIGLHPGRQGMKMALVVQSVLQAEIMGMQSKLANDFSDADKKKLQELQRETMPDGKDKTKARIAEDEAESQELISGGYQSEMMAGAESMLRSIDPDKMYDMCIDLFEHCLANGHPLKDPAAIDRHFQGRFGDVFPLAKAVIEANGFLELSIQALLE